MYFDLDFFGLLPGRFPLTAAAIAAFLFILLGSFLVPAAAAANAVFTDMCPAPGARLLRTKTVKCFFASVAIIIVPPR